MELPVYLDHAATTPLAPDALAAMLPYFTEWYGNASALYSLGQAERVAVENARQTVDDALYATPEEIIFTSGGTESNNMVARGLAEAHPDKRHLLTTPIEHHAVLEPLETLARQGYALEMLPVDAEGRVSPDDVARRLRPDTLLVSVMHANNDIGTVQPIGEIGAACRERGVWFHTDATQSFGKLPLDVRALNIDLLTLSAHKLYGPKGIGALYARRGIALARFQEGGGQERGRRAGTLNVPGIVGLGKATELSLADRDAEARRLTDLRDWFMERLLTIVPGARINGSRMQRLPNNIHFCLSGMDGEPLLLALDAAGICASAGSACSAGSTEPSHVLKAIGLDREVARGALRLTLGRATTPEALGYALITLADAARDLRGLSYAGAAR